MGARIFENFSTPEEPAVLNLNFGRDFGNTLGFPSAKKLTEINKWLVCLCLVPPQCRNSFSGT